MDTSVQIGILTLLGTLITVSGGVLIAVINGKKEKEAAVETTLEKTLRERLLLRDEQLVDLANDLEASRQREAEKDRTIAELTDRINALVGAFRVGGEGEKVP